MRETLRHCGLVLILAALLAGAAFAQESVQINELVEHSLQWNGKTVTVEGEAIGEMLPRGDFAWVNINDGTNAIGVWLPLADAEKINCYGDYHHNGDTVRVTGMFSRDCAEHGGDVDVHSTAFRVVKTGTTVVHSASGAKKAAAGALSAAALIAAYFCLIPHARRH